MQIVSDCKVKKHVKRIDYEVQDARRGNATEGSMYYIYIFEAGRMLQDYVGVLASFWKISTQLCFLTLRSFKVSTKQTESSQIIQAYFPGWYFLRWGAKSWFNQRKIQFFLYSLKFKVESILWNTFIALKIGKRWPRLLQPKKFSHMCVLIPTCKMW